MSEPKDLDKLTASDLKQTIVNLQSEILDLIRICSKMNEASSRLPEAAANILATLKKKLVLGIAPQAALDIDTVNPGVSRNNNDAVTEENTELEEGSELFKNPINDNAIRELYEMVVKLLEEIVQSGHHINELKETSASRETELVSKLKTEIEEKEKIQKRLNELMEEINQSKFPESVQERLNELNQKSERLQKEKEIHIATIRRINELLKRKSQTIEDFQAQVAEKDAMRAMHIDCLKAYVDDFKSENEEKEKIKKRLNESNQESERLRREHQSHMATVRHFESEIERMNKLLNEKTKSNSNNGFPFGQPLGSSAPQNVPQDRNPAPIVVADGGGGVNESTGGTRQTNTSINPPKSSPTLIECPYCSRSYPYHLIEGHVQDCMKDSLGRR